MAAFPQLDSFISGFCTEQLEREDLENFHTEECKVRIRDIVRSAFIRPNQEQLDAKFDRLLEIRNHYIENLKLLPSLVNYCDLNLERLSPDRFFEKMVKEGVSLKGRTQVDGTIEIRSFR